MSLKEEMEAQRVIDQMKSTLPPEGLSTTQSVCPECGLIHPPLKAGETDISPSVKITIPAIKRTAAKYSINSYLYFCTMTPKIITGTSLLLLKMTRVG